MKEVASVPMKCSFVGHVDTASHSFSQHEPGSSVITGTIVDQITGRRGEFRLMVGNSEFFLGVDPVVTITVKGTKRIMLPEGVSQNLFESYSKLSNKEREWLDKHAREASSV